MTKIYSTNVKIKILLIVYVFSFLHMFYNKHINRISYVQIF